MHVVVIYNRIIGSFMFMFPSWVRALQGSLKCRAVKYNMMLSMVTLRILRVEAQTWTWTFKQKQACFEKNWLKGYVYLYFLCGIYTCLDQLFSSKFDACNINNRFCFIEDIHIMRKFYLPYFHFQHLIKRLEC